MKSNKPNSSSVNQGIIISGAGVAFNARNIAVGAHSSITESSGGGGREDREQLAQHFNSLEKALASIPQEMANQRATIESFMTVMKQEAAKPEPNPSLWKVTGAGLLDAAKSVASVAPTLLQTAKLISDFVH